MAKEGVHLGDRFNFWTWNYYPLIFNDLKFVSLLTNIPPWQNQYRCQLDIRRLQSVANHDTLIIAASVRFWVFPCANHGTDSVNYALSKLVLCCHLAAVIVYGNHYSGVDGLYNLKTSHIHTFTTLVNFNGDSILPYHFEVTLLNILTLKNIPVACTYLCCVFNTQI